MNKRLFALLAALCIALGCLAGCSSDPAATPTTEPPVAETTAPQETYVDYAAEAKLDMNSDSVKQEVTVKAYVDGDTTHFHVPKTVTETGLLKARYLAVNTPESTG